MRRLFLAALATLSLAATFPLPAAAATATPKVAIVVGPVGSLTPTYLHLAELAAATAEHHGALVARAYSPDATPGNVLAAVENADIVIYFGHGYGHPSPYGGLDTARQNGWGLQGPQARGTHGDSLGGELAYYGEDWIVANARPAPGFVMIYSNVCYAPGASEGGFAPATETDALMRVAHYSRKVFRMGGSAYYAIDFDRGASDLVGRLLGSPTTGYGSVFASDHRYVAAALRAFAHPFSTGQRSGCIARSTPMARPTTGTPLPAIPMRRRHDPGIGPHRPPPSSREPMTWHPTPRSTSESASRSPASMPRRGR